MSMLGRYILREHEPVHCEDLMEWGKFFENAERVVKQENVGDVSISTVFLGLDHQSGSGPPLLFETMIFGGKARLVSGARYSTWDEAEAGHAKAVALAREP